MKLVSLYTSGYLILVLSSETKRISSINKEFSNPPKRSNVINIPPRYSSSVCLFLLTKGALSSVVARSSLGREVHAVKPRHSLHLCLNSYFVRGMSYKKLSAELYREHLHEIQIFSHF